MNKEILLKVKNAVKKGLPFEAVYTNNVFKINTMTYAVVFKLLFSETLTPEYKAIIFDLDNQIQYQEFVNQPYGDCYVAISYTVSDKTDDYDCLYKTLEAFKREFDVKIVDIENLLELIYNFNYPFYRSPFLIPNNFSTLGRKLDTYIYPSNLKYRFDSVQLGNAYVSFLNLNLIFDDTVDIDRIIFYIYNNFSSENIYVSKHYKHLDKSTQLDKLRQKCDSIDNIISHSDSKKLSENKLYEYRNLKEELEYALDNADNVHSEFFEMILMVAIFAQDYDTLLAQKKEMKKKLYSDLNIRFAEMTHAMKNAYISFLPFARMQLFDNSSKITNSHILLMDKSGIFRAVTTLSP